MPWYAYLALAAVLYLAVALFSIDKPLTQDQANPVAYNAAAIADFGYAALGSSAYDYEIAHPVLHQHLLAWLYDGFGKTTITTRVLNVLCTFLVLFLLIQICRETFPQEEGDTIGGIAAVLYAINPFVIQHSLIVDQDTTIHPVALLLFFLVFARQQHYSNLSTIAKIGSMLALCIWAKEFSLVFIIFPLFLYLWLRLGLIRAMWIAGGVAAVGAALFWATWMLYCWSTGVPVFSFIEFSILGKAMNSDFHDDRSVLTALLVLLGRTGPWVTPAFFILLAMAAGRRLSQLRMESYVARTTDLFWLFVVVFWVITTFLMYGMSRWQFPLYGVACILVAEYTFDVVRNIKLLDIFVAIGCGIAVAAVIGLVLDDPLLREPGQSFPGMAVWYASLWFAGPFLACFVLLTALRGPALSRSRLFVTLMSLLVATSLGMNIRQTAAYTTIPSWPGDYGETGFYETLTFLEKSVGETEPIIRKDLAFYLQIGKYGRDFEWIYTSIFRGDLHREHKKEEIVSLIRQPRVRYVVIDQYAAPDQAITVIEPYFECSATFGDFKICSKLEKNNK